MLNKPRYLGHIQGQCGIVLNGEVLPPTFEVALEEGDTALVFVRDGVLFVEDWTDKVGEGDVCES